MYRCKWLQNPEIKILKLKIMKTLNLENLSEMILSNEEMLNVRGGNGTNPSTPPIIIEL